MIGLYDLLREFNNFLDRKQPRDKYQIFCDMDGVLVDFPASIVSLMKDILNDLKNIVPLDMYR